jgi:transposase-like protein
VDKYGATIDFLLTEHRDKDAALRFLKKAIRRNGVPETITIDGSDANEAAIKCYNEEHGTTIVIRQVKYLNNVVEQDHRAVKRVTRPMLGFKSFDAAQDTLVGIELMHMIKKRQMVLEARGRGLCRKIAFLRQNPKIVYWKINDFRVQTFLFSVICDKAPFPRCVRGCTLVS